MYADVDTRASVLEPEGIVEIKMLRERNPGPHGSDRFAKPTIWENARRHFYWAVRARIAKSAALVDIAEASPNSTVECRIQSLDSLVQIDSKPEYRKIAEALEKLDLSDYYTTQSWSFLAPSIELNKEDRKVTMDGLVRLVDHLTSEKANLVTVLQSRASPGRYIPYFPHSVAVMISLILSISFRLLHTSHLFSYLLP
ncbi:hypothetical protein C0989_001924 [Termitomyces sp. Mn162]|nr:hypothetical protein C0989_001924 [Termitomyces sp. Mn162]